ncbi:MAG: chorismate synthase [Chloroflexi bacterium]|nr:chorismate synthase [Chloroflexota bacterium]
MLQFLTAGESHGPCLTAIVEGLPAGVPLTEEWINRDLARRQVGYGRGGRMQVEYDVAALLGGVANGRTIGAPLSLQVANRDWVHWQGREEPIWTVPRPGHADLPGSRKYGLDDLRLVAERASARETAARVAVGAAARALLAEVGVRVGSYVEAIGGQHAKVRERAAAALIDAAERSIVRCPDPQAAAKMQQAIDAARAVGESLGGWFVVVVLGVPAGLGSHVHWDRRLDGRLAQAVMSVPAVKGVEIGEAFANAALPGTAVHDAFVQTPDGGWMRASNRAGGLEGGITNGQPLWLRAAMKPIPTTGHGLPSFDVQTGQPAPSPHPRADVCAVPAAGVVAEAMVCWVLAQALLERHGGDTLAQIQQGVARDR